MNTRRVIPALLVLLAATVLGVPIGLLAAQQSDMGRTIRANHRRIDANRLRIDANERQIHALTEQLVQNNIEPIVFPAPRSTTTVGLLTTRQRTPAERRAPTAVPTSARATATASPPPSSTTTAPQCPTPASIDASCVTVP